MILKYISIFATLVILSSMSNHPHQNNAVPIPILSDKD